MITRHFGPTRRAIAFIVGLVLVVSGCTSTSADQPIGPIIDVDVDVDDEADALTAVELVRGLSEIVVPYTTRGTISEDWDKSQLEAASSFFDAAAGTVDMAAVHECWQQQYGEMAARVVGFYELTHEGFRAHKIGPELWVVAYRMVEVVPDLSDMTTDRAMYVTNNGIIGERSNNDSGDQSCWNASTSRTDLGGELFTTASSADNTSFGPYPDDVDLDLAISGHPEDVPETSTDGQFAQRDGLQADPHDPEPIESTGSDKLDILKVTDPSTFVCTSYLGRVEEQILSSDKSGYEFVADAFLFTAYFSDGVTIDIRVHPEVGTLEQVTEEVEKYLAPLGQLPTLLRRDIGRFAIRSGDETATASPLEGISMQTGNTAVRLADNRLEETIFHESVHTSLDPIYVYGSSTEWFDIQDLDGRFLTEYGRDRSKGEDLAETALYAYVLLHYPERIPASLAAEIRDRVPHRLDFIESLLPPETPIFDLVEPEPTCDSP